MTDVFNSYFDVAIVGGGPAGLSAALILGRSVRKVIVFERGPTRNSASKLAHGVFSRDGVPTAELLDIGHQQLSPYNITVEENEIVDIDKKNDGFELISPTGSRATSRKVILCTGVVDILPEIPGIRKFWGKSVVHCPYCHGWELRNEPIAALVNSRTIVNFASLLKGWSDDLILLSNGPIKINKETRRKIDANEIPVIQQKIARLAGKEDRLTKIIFKSGKELKRKGLFIHPHQRLRSKLIDRLDLELNSEGRINTNRFGETNIAGIYAAGDVGPNMQQVTIAASTGAEVGIAINHKLVEEDFNDFV